MKLVLIIFSVFMLAGTAQAQSTIKLEDVAKHAGDSITVCGKIVDGYYAARVENTPTFLNVGARYPNQLLTIVIWGDVRKKFEVKPEEQFKDKDVCITGRITEFQGKPQIVINSPWQLKAEK